jgi:excisionase family DNA binding protein
MNTNTNDFITALRSDIQNEVKEQLLSELLPIIEVKLYDNTFSIKEAAKYLRISESTLRKLVDAKEVPNYRIRGQIFFRQVSLEQWRSNLENENIMIAQ